MADKKTHYDSIQKITYYTRGESTIIHTYFRVNNVPYRFSTKTSDPEKAAEIATAKKIETKQGRDIRVVTVKKAVIDFLKYKENRVSEKTHTDLSRIGSIIISFMGDEEVGFITQRRFNELIDFRKDLHLKDRTYKSYTRNRKRKVEKRYRKAGNRTLNLFASTFLSILRHASIHLQCIDYNKIPRWKKLREKARDEFITEDEMFQIREYYLSKSNDYYADIVTFTFYTGLRLMSEINRIKWKDVDLENNSVIIRDRKHHSRNKISRIALLKNSKNVLLGIKKRSKWTADDDFVFVDKNGKQVSSFINSFKTALKKLHLNESYVLYSLRHGFATWALQEGVRMNVVADMLGHVDTKMAERVYGHLVHEDMKEHLGKIPGQEHLLKNVQKKKKEITSKELSIRRFSKDSA